MYPALIDDMLRDLGNVDETILYSDSIDLMLNSKAIDIPFDYSDEDFTDIEITMCEKCLGKVTRKESCILQFCFFSCYIIQRTVTEQRIFHTK